MILTLDNFLPNDYVIEPPTTSSDSFINAPTGLNTFNLHSIEYFRGFPAYTKPLTHGVDIFEYLKPATLEKLKHGNMIFVLDYSMEGFEPSYLPIAKQLHESCLKHEIDSRKIYLLTGNHRESITYDYFRQIYHFNYGINIVQTITVSDMVVMGNPIEADDIQYHIKNSKEKHKDKFFLHLSRRNRAHRSMANYLLTQTPAMSYGLASQDKLSDHDVMHLVGYHNKSPHVKRIEKDEIDSWNINLPMIADSNEFHINWASNRADHLYHETLFSVVLETSADDSAGTTMFPSEKTFKPIIHRHPMIIFGHRGINTFLHELGFKPYGDWFNYQSFDFDTDPVTRYKKILGIVNTLCTELKNMTHEERIAWRFKNQDVLNYNYERLAHGHRKNEEIFNFHRTVSSYFENRFFSYLSTSTC